MNINILFPIFQLIILNFMDYKSDLFINLPLF